MVKKAKKSVVGSVAQTSINCDHRGLQSERNSSSENGPALLHANSGNGCSQLLSSAASHRRKACPYKDAIQNVAHLNGSLSTKSSQDRSKQNCSAQRKSFQRLNGATPLQVKGLLHRTKNKANNILQNKLLVKRKEPRVNGAIHNHDSTSASTAEDIPVTLESVHEAEKGSKVTVCHRHPADVASTGKLCIQETVSQRNSSRKAGPKDRSVTTVAASSDSNANGLELQESTCSESFELASTCSSLSSDFPEYAASSPPLTRNLREPVPFCKEFSALPVHLDDVQSTETAFSLKDFIFQEVHLKSNCDISSLGTLKNSLLVEQGQWCALWDSLQQRHSAANSLVHDDIVASTTESSPAAVPDGKSDRVTDSDNITTLECDTQFVCSLGSSSGSENAHSPTEVPAHSAQLGFPSSVSLQSDLTTESSGKKQCSFSEMSPEVHRTNALSTGISTVHLTGTPVVLLKSVRIETLLSPQETSSAAEHSSSDEDSDLSSFHQVAASHGTLQHEKCSAVASDDSATPADRLDHDERRSCLSETSTGSSVCEEENLSTNSTRSCSQHSFDPSEDHARQNDCRKPLATVCKNLRVKLFRLPDAVINTCVNKFPSKSKECLQDLKTKGSDNEHDLLCASAKDSEVSSEGSDISWPTESEESRCVTPATPVNSDSEKDPDSPNTFQPLELRTSKETDSVNVAQVSVPRTETSDKLSSGSVKSSCSSELQKHDEVPSAPCRDIQADLQQCKVVITSVKLSPEEQLTCADSTAKQKMSVHSKEPISKMAFSNNHPSPAKSEDVSRSSPGKSPKTRMLRHFGAKWATSLSKTKCKTKNKMSAITGSGTSSSLGALSKTEGTSSAPSVKRANHRNCIPTAGISKSKKRKLDAENFQEAYKTGSIRGTKSDGRETGSCASSVVGALSETAGASSRPSVKRANHESCLPATGISKSKQRRLSTESVQKANGTTLAENQRSSLMVVKDVDNNTTNLGKPVGIKDRTLSKTTEHDEKTTASGEHCITVNTSSSRSTNESVQDNRFTKSVSSFLHVPHVEDRQQRRAAEHRTLSKGDRKQDEVINPHYTDLNLDYEPDYEHDVLHLNAEEESPLSDCAEGKMSSDEDDFRDDSYLLDSQNSCTEMEDSTECARTSDTDPSGTQVQGHDETLVHIEQAVNQSPPVQLQDDGPCQDPEEAAKIPCTESKEMAVVSEERPKPCVKTASSSSDEERTDERSFKRVRFEEKAPSPAKSTSDETSTHTDKPTCEEKFPELVEHYGHAGYCRQLLMNGECRRAWCRFRHESPDLIEVFNSINASDTSTHHHLDVGLCALELFVDCRTCSGEIKEDIIAELFEICLKISVERCLKICNIAEKYRLLTCSLCYRLVMFCQEDPQGTYCIIVKLAKTYEEGKLNCKLMPKLCELAYKCGNWMLLASIMTCTSTMYKMLIPEQYFIELLKHCMSKSPTSSPLAGQICSVLKTLIKEEFRKICADNVREFATYLQRCPSFAVDAEHILERLNRYRTDGQSQSSMDRTSAEVQPAQADSVSCSSRKLPLPLSEQIATALLENDKKKIKFLFEKAVKKEDCSAILRIQKYFCSDMYKIPERFRNLVEAVSGSKDVNRLPPEQFSLLSQIGCALMLETYSRNIFNIAFEILSALHMYGMNYSELQSYTLSEDFKKLRAVVTELPFVPPSHAQCSAIDICIRTMHDPVQILSLFKAFKWVYPENFGSRFKTSIHKWRTGLLLKLSEQLCKIKCFTECREVFVQCVNSLEKDFDKTQPEAKKLKKDACEAFHNHLAAMFNDGFHLADAEKLYKECSLLDWLEVEIKDTMKRALVVCLCEHGDVAKAQEYFNMFVLTGVYPVKLQSVDSYPRSVRIPSILSKDEFRFFMENYLDKLFQMLTGRMMEEVPEKWFSLKIHLLESCVEECHRITSIINIPHTLKDAHFRMKCALKELDLQVNDAAVNSWEILHVCHQSLYKKFLAWESEKHEGYLEVVQNPNKKSPVRTSVQVKPLSECSFGFKPDAGISVAFGSCSLSSEQKPAEACSPTEQPGSSPSIGNTFPAESTTVRETSGSPSKQALSEETQTPQGDVPLAKSGSAAVTSTCNNSTLPTSEGAALLTRTVHLRGNSPGKCERAGPASKSTSESSQHQLPASSIQNASEQTVFLAANTSAKVSVAFASKLLARSATKRAAEEKVAGKKSCEKATKERSSEEKSKKHKLSSKLSQVNMFSFDRNLNLSVCVSGDSSSRTVVMDTPAKGTGRKTSDSFCSARPQSVPDKSNANKQPCMVQLQSSPEKQSSPARTSVCKTPPSVVTASRSPQKAPSKKFEPVRHSTERLCAATASNVALQYKRQARTCSEKAEFHRSPQKSPRASPHTSPRASPHKSPRASPHKSPRAFQQAQHIQQSPARGEVQVAATQDGIPGPSLPQTAGSCSTSATSPSPVQDRNVPVCSTSASSKRIRIKRNFGSITPPAVGTSSPSMCPPEKSLVSAEQSRTTPRSKQTSDSPCSSGSGGIKQKIENYIKSQLLLHREHFGEQDKQITDKACKLTRQFMRNNSLTNESHLKSEIMQKLIAFCQLNVLA